MLALLFLPSEGKDTSHFSLVPHGVPARGDTILQSEYFPRPLFTNCSSMDHHLGVQSFRNRILQHGSPTAPQFLTANLLLHGLLWPWVYKSCQNTAPVQAFCGFTASFGHPPALTLSPSVAADNSQVHCRRPCAAGTQLLHHGLHHGLQRISPLMTGIPPPPPPPALTWVSAELFLSHILSPFFGCNCCSAAFFFPFLLKTLPSRHHHCHWRVQPWPMSGPSWSPLALPPLDVGRPASTFSQKPPLQPSLLPKAHHTNPTHRISWMTDSSLYLPNTKKHPSAVCTGPLCCLISPLHFAGCSSGGQTEMTSKNFCLSILIQDL